jgi:transcriptional regulator with XRE-family HTH domain
MTSRDTTFGDFVAQRRAGRKLSADELAHETGVDAQAVKRWEAGEEQPSDPQLARLARALAVPMDEIFVLAGRTLAGPDAMGVTP